MPCGGEICAGTGGEGGGDTGGKDLRLANCSSEVDERLSLGSTALLSSGAESARGKDMLDMRLAELFFELSLPESLRSLNRDSGLYLLCTMVQQLE